ncbi:hypothetical protein P9112_010563 [Eukaryota sp. TZLM1-RC]
MPLFGKRKSVADYIKRLSEALSNIPNISDETALRTIHHEINKCSHNLRDMLYHAEDTAATDNEAVTEFIKHNLVRLILSTFTSLEFEARKDIISVLSHLLCDTLFVNHLLSLPDAFSSIMTLYTNPSLTIHTGTFIREGVVKSSAICNHFLTMDTMNLLFGFVNVESFDISSDAFSTLNTLLTSHKDITADFINANYTDFFKGFEGLILSENYVIRRSSLRLLAEILLERSCFEIMTRFISEMHNLKVVMNLLLTKSRHIQYEAFHVFKIFVANPNKTSAIENVLCRNSQKLVLFLEKFHCDGDDQLEEEVSLLIKEIQMIGGTCEEEQDSN